MIIAFHGPDYCIHELYGSRTIDTIRLPIEASKTINMLLKAGVFKLQRSGMAFFKVDEVHLRLLCNGTRLPATLCVI
jgi:hypothetical protein